MIGTVGIGEETGGGGGRGEREEGGRCLAMITFLS